MKKLVVFLLILSTLFSALAFKTETNVLLGLENVEKVCLVSERKFDQEGVEVVQSGNDFYNFCDTKIAREIYKRNKNFIKNIQIYVKKANLSEIFDFLKFELVEKQELEGVNVYCGYSPYLPGGYMIENKKCNVQFAEKEDEIIIGYPVILTGF